MTTEKYTGEQAIAYRQGFAAGEKDSRAERGLMIFGRSFAGDHATELNCAAWLDGFADGQRSVGMNPEDTYGEKK